MLLSRNSDAVWTSSGRLRPCIRLQHCTEKRYIRRCAGLSNDALPAVNCRLQSTLANAGMTNTCLRVHESLCSGALRLK